MPGGTQSLRSFRAKWAFLVFEVFAVISTLVCLKILPKSWVIHQRHWIQYKWAKITNNPTAAKRHAELAKAKTERERKNTVLLEDDHGTDETPATAEDKMVAIEV
jgi:cytochrome c biogenesis protein ResB